MHTLSFDSNKNKIALVVLCTVLFMIAVADTVLNLALPAISGSLGATDTQLLWIVDVYLLVVATLQITFGSVGDRYGRKRLLQIGLVSFGLGSFGSVFASSADMLIIFRIATALGAAIMMPSTMSILTDIFREPNERARAIAIWSSVFSIGAGLGPIIGGYLLQQFTWTYIFYLNLPIVIVGLVGSFLFLPESKGDTNVELNFVSIGLSATGLVALVYAIITAGEYGWFSTQIFVLFGVATILLFAFVFWERRAINSMFPLTFFRNRSFTGSSIALTLSSFALMGSLFFFSQYFQSVQGYSPLETGLCMLPLSLFVFIFTLLSVRIDNKIGTKLTVTLGLFVTGCSLIVFGFTAGVNTSYWVSLVVLFMMSIGLGLVFSTATNAVMNSIPTSRAGVGSAMNDTTRQIGGALGIAVLGSLVNSIYALRINASETINALPLEIGDLMRKSLQSAEIAAHHLPADTASAVIDYAKQAFLAGLQQSVFIGAAILILAAVISLVLLPKRTPPCVGP